MTTGLLRMTGGGAGLAAAVPQIPYETNDLLTLLTLIAATAAAGYVFADGLVERLTGVPLRKYTSKLIERSAGYIRDVVLDKYRCHIYNCKIVQR